MKLITQVVALVAVAVAAALPDADAFGCKPAEVQGWMAACDQVTASTQAKCNDRLCHVALHRLVEQETIDCYVSSSLGPASDLAIYKAIDDFCHGEGPDPLLTPTPPVTPAPVPTTTAPVTTSVPPAPTTPAPVCKPSDVKTWIAACDRVTTSTQAKCNDLLCKLTLPRIVKEETTTCYVSSGLGPANDLAIFKSLQDFCLGVGPDPYATPAPVPSTTAPVTTQPAPVPSTTAPVPTTPAPKPSC